MVHHPFDPTEYSIPVLGTPSPVSQLQNATVNCPPQELWNVLNNTTRHSSKEHRIRCPSKWFFSVSSSNVFC
ncbi:hypothetical protein BaRGS_00027174 [Batillaria attramentaria]|uniref:Uncharacterized protein n=1 Tax=Batillaria attramentaria TaxID=370345 RepID=A0ABD0K3S0_9CAEN